MEFFTIVESRELSGSSNMALFSGNGIICMLNHPSSNFARINAPLCIAIAIACALHGLLFGIGMVWEPSCPPPKPRGKVIVQTISLDSNRTVAVDAKRELIAPEIENKKEPEVVQIVKQDKIEPSQKIKIPIDPVVESPPLKEKEILPVEVRNEKSELLMPAVLEENPSEGNPKPVIKSPAEKIAPPGKKKEPKKSALPKKIPASSKPALPSKSQSQQQTSVKPKAIDEVEKKRQEQIATLEKKKQQEKVELEKKQQAKKQQEKLAAEKKVQQEKAAAEKKRQEEIAAAQELAKKKEQATLARAKESLAKMGETREKISANSSTLSTLTSAAIPSAVSDLHVDALVLNDSTSKGAWGVRENRYSDEVAYRLKASLRLPDYGAVIIKLTLDRNGKVLKCETVRSESIKNKTYVESKVPSIVFSTFGQQFQGVEQTTFVITLQND